VTRPTKHHLKEVMTSCNPSVRLHELRHSATRRRNAANAMVLETGSSATPSTDASTSDAQVKLVCPRDILSGTETAPHLLGDNLPITQERLMLIQ
jgi:hypothetical protein